MEELEEIINDKRREILWKTKTTGATKVEYDRYGLSRLITFWSQPGVRDDVICHMIKDAPNPRKIHHLHLGDAVV